MGRKSGGRFPGALMAAAAVAALLVPGCTATPVPGPTGSARTSVSVEASGSTSAPGTDIAPHAVGPSLPFECGNPIGSGPAAAKLAGPDAIGVPDLVYISASATGGTIIQWVGGASYQGLHLSKVGLVLKAGRSFTLEVPAELRGHMKIGWSNSGYTLADSLHSPGCTANTDNAEWLVYPGGFWLDAPACVPLTVKHGEQVETLHLPIGKTCP